LPCGLGTALPFLFFGKWFIEFWVGKDMVPSTLLLVGFIMWSLVNCYIGSISTFLNSGALVGKQITYYGLATVCALVLKVVGAPILLTAAVVWSTVIGYGLFYIIPATMIAFKHLYQSKNIKNTV